MAMFKIKTTWMERGTNNAAGIGNDETNLVEGRTAREACEQAAKDSADFHDIDWETGKYDIIADHVNGGMLTRLSGDFVEA